MERFAVLIDLASARLGEAMLRKMFDDIADIGSVEYVKFYNYNTKRHRELSALVRELGAEVDLPEMGRKKVRIDMREVIDAVHIASTSEGIGAFFLICSEVDAMYLVNFLKKLGKTIYLGVTQKTTLSERVHHTYIMDRALELEDANIVSDEVVEDAPHTDVSKPCIKESDDSDSSTPNNIISISSIEDEVACSSTSRVKGKKENIFPYSDIERDDIKEEMADIDRRINDMIDARKRANIVKLFDDDIS